MNWLIEVEVFLIEIILIRTLESNGLLNLVETDYLLDKRINLPKCILQHGLGSDPAEQSGYQLRLIDVGDAKVVKLLLRERVVLR